MGAVGKTLAAPFVQTFKSVKQIATAPGKATIGQVANVASAGVIAPNLKAAPQYYAGVASDVALVAGAAELTGAAGAAAPTASSTITSAAAPTVGAPAASLSPLASTGAPSLGLSIPGLTTTAGTVPIDSGVSTIAAASFDSTGAIAAGAPALVTPSTSVLSEIGSLGYSAWSGLATVTKDIISVPLAILGAIGLVRQNGGVGAPASSSIPYLSGEGTTIVNTPGQPGQQGTTQFLPGGISSGAGGAGSGGGTTILPATAQADYSIYIILGLAGAVLWAMFHKGK